MLKTPTTQQQGIRLKEPWRQAQNMPHGRSVHVSQLIDEYLRSPKYAELKTSSKLRYMSSLRLFENLILGTGKSIYYMRAPKVDYSIVDYIHHILDYTHGPSTIQFHFNVMSCVWKQALRTGRVIHNPWSSPGIKVNNERDITWTKEELYKAYDEAKKLGYNVLALYILMMYETGQRPWKDLRNLTWDNIKEEEGRKVLDFTISKTGTHIILPLSDLAVKALAECDHNHTYIFVNTKGTRPPQGSLQTQFEVVKTRSGIRDELQFRDIRRTVVTEMAEAGSTSEEIRAITGWRNPDVMHRYARVRYKTAQNGMDKREKQRQLDATAEGMELYKSVTPPKKYFDTF